MKPTRDETLSPEACAQLLQLLREFILHAIAKLPEEERDATASEEDAP